MHTAAPALELNANRIAHVTRKNIKKQRINARTTATHQLASFTYMKQLNKRHKTTRMSVLASRQQSLGLLLAVTWLLDNVWLTNRKNKKKKQIVCRVKYTRSEKWVAEGKKTYQHMQLTDTGRICSYHADRSIPNWQKKRQANNGSKKQRIKWKWCVHDGVLVEISYTYSRVVACECDCNSFSSFSLSSIWSIRFLVAHYIDFNAAMLTNLTLKYNNVQLAHYYCNVARCSCVCTLYWRASAPIAHGAHIQPSSTVFRHTNQSIVYAPCTPVMQINNSVRWSMGLRSFSLFIASLSQFARTKTMRKFTFGRSAAVAAADTNLFWPFYFRIPCWTVSSQSIDCFPSREVLNDWQVKSCVVSLMSDGTAWNIWI